MCSAIIEHIDRNADFISTQETRWHNLFTIDRSSRDYEVTLASRGIHEVLRRRWDKVRLKKKVLHDSQLLV